jgi:integral membrane protein (TIGR01906 family)
MTPLFLLIEYNRPGFPQDFYGFTTEDRLMYAPYTLQYLLNGEDIAFLGGLRFPDGSDLYTVRELQHMRDVKTVAQLAYMTAIIVGLLAIVAIYILLHQFRSLAAVALIRGSVLAVSLVAAIVVAAVISWNTFFSSFHSVFFASGTWQFEYSDTLIRLFPEQFWFDAGIAIGVMTAGGSGVIWVFARRKLS